MVALSGCSGGGKSTLLAELGLRGVATIEEPGRVVVREALAGDGAALPERDPGGFAVRCAELTLAAVAALPEGARLCVLDRSPVDAAAWLEGRGLPAPPALRRSLALPLAREVLWAPPWPELFRPDAERRHDFAAAVEEVERLAPAYRARGHDLIELPRLAPAARAEWALARLSERGLRP